MKLSNILNEKSAAALSLHIYKDNDQPNIGLWKVYVDSDQLGLSKKSSSTEPGFYAIAYAFYYLSRAPSIYIVFRGTTSVFDSIDNFLVMMNKVPNRFINQGIPFIEAFIRRLQLDFPPDKWGGTCISFAGHSLGGILAELAYCRELGIDRGDDLHAQLGYSFDSPGAKKMVQRAVQQGVISQKGYTLGSKSITIYQSGINAINTCNEQLVVDDDDRPWGLTVCHLDYQCKDAIHSTGGLGGPSIESYFKYYTVGEQHKMKNIYDCIINTKEQHPVWKKNWPVGFWKGYHAYRSLDYGLSYPNRKHWSKHTLTYWREFEHVRQRFKTLSEYRQYFIKLFLIEKKIDLSKVSDLSVYSQQPDDLFFIPEGKLNIVALVKGGKSSLIKKLPLNKLYLLNQRNDFGELPLHEAVKLGHHEVAILLLSLGSDPNQQDVRGNTAAHMLVYSPINEDGEKIASLISPLISLDIRNNEGLTGWEALQKFVDKCTEQHDKKTSLQIL